MKRIQEKHPILASTILEGNVTLAEVYLKSMSPQDIQEYAYDLFQAAIKSDQTNILKLFIKYGITVEIILREYPHYQPLGFAIFWKRFNAIEFLLAQQIEITEQHIASAYNAPFDPQKEIFNLFLRSNKLTFYPDKTDQYRYFIFAIQGGHLETVKRSLKKVTSKTILYLDTLNNTTCIHWAIASKQKEIFKLLALFYLKHHEVVQAKTNIKQIIFYYAIANSIVEIVQIMLTPAHLKDVHLEQEFVSSKVGYSALYEAITARRIALENSEKHSEDVNAKKSLEDSNEIITLLLSIGADFGHRSDYFIAQMEPIEHAKRTCITPLYSKIIKENLQQFSATEIKSIIAEYAMPDFTTYGEPMPYSMQRGLAHR